MDSQQFDAIVRDLFAGSIARRSVLAGVAGGLLALAGGRRPEEATAKEERKKRKKKPLKRNEFGCVPVGKACRGNDNVCCSGICDGKKPKKGDRDRSECVAHDEGGCERGQREIACGGSVDTPCTPTEGPFGVCQTTTGNAGFCMFVAAGCSSCRTDADCQASEGNPLAACIRCTACPEGTGCAIP